MAEGPRGLGIQKKCTEAVERASHTSHASRKRPAGSLLEKAKRDRTMVATASRALVAPLARRRTQLQEKAKYRPEKKIARRLPAGAGALAKIPKGKDFKGAGEFLRGEFFRRS